MSTLESVDLGWGGHENTPEGDTGPHKSSFVRINK